MRPGRCERASRTSGPARRPHSAWSVTETTASESVRKANASLARGDLDEDNRLYEAAEVVSADPGLVAFNRATVLFQGGNYADAARYYQLVLNDGACPPERAAKAWYNRGTSLLRQQGATTTTYRSAIACLERCIDTDAADAPLKANAAYNLRLAKLLWNDARKKENSATIRMKIFRPRTRSEPAEVRGSET